MSSTPSRVISGHLGSSWAISGPLGSSQAEGFRRIAYYYDRPDVMATFSRVRLEAGKELHPAML